MPRTGDVHVIPTGDEWAIEVEAQNGWSVYPTQDKAIREGRKLAADNRSELLIHWRQHPPVRDGRFERHSSANLDVLAELGGLDAA